MNLEKLVTIFSLFLVMVKDEEATCMYVLYFGEVAIYADKECSP